MSFPVNIFETLSVDFYRSIVLKIIYEIVLKQDVLMISLIIYNVENSKTLSFFF